MHTLIVRIATAAGVLAIVALGFTAPAHADGIWYQAYGRTSADQACPAPADETPWQDTFTGQREWSASWARWMNGNTGGWVCDRTIIWAGQTPPSAPAPTGAGCQLVETDFGGFVYADFGTSMTLASGPWYSDAACTTTLGGSWSELLYYSGGAQPTAAALCTAAFGGTHTGADNRFVLNRNIWDCNAA